MSASISENNISLTRGDTLVVDITISKLTRGDNGTVVEKDYVPQEGDTIRFALKKDLADQTPLFLKTIDPETLQLRLEAEETKLPVGRYIYDIELTTGIGEVDTFIGPATFRITDEVY